MWINADDAHSVLRSGGGSARLSPTAQAAWPRTGNDLFILLGIMRRPPLSSTASDSDQQSKGISTQLPVSAIQSMESPPNTDAEFGDKTSLVRDHDALRRERCGHSAM